RVEHLLHALEVGARIDQGRQQHVTRDPCGRIDEGLAGERGVHGPDASARGRSGMMRPSPSRPGAAAMPLAAPAPVARFDDVAAGHAVQFSRADRVIEAWPPDEVRPALAAVEEAVAGGAWAFGMLASEAAAGLDPQARVRAPRAGLPRVWFGLVTAPHAAARPLPTGQAFTRAPCAAVWV